jgi:glycine/D-amino acid oxidase-like deaminating enzyme
MTSIDYSKSSEIENLSIPKNVTIIGCGGTGAWAALYAAIAGVSRIIIFDNALVDNTGLARLPFVPTKIGMKKVDAVTSLVRDYRPEIVVEAYDRYFEVPNDVGLIAGPILNCSDSPEFVKSLSEYAAQNSLRHIFAPYAGLSAAVMEQCPSNLSLDGTAGYWVGSSALAAALAVTAAFGNSFNYIVDPAIKLSSIKSIDWTKSMDYVAGAGQC